MKSINEELNLSPLEVVVVDGRFEEAFRNFKALIQKEKILTLYKEKQFYEKPSDKKRRKRKQAAQRRMMMEALEKQIQSGEWEKRKQQKEAKKVSKIENKKNSGYHE